MDSQFKAVVGKTNGPKNGTGGKRRVPQKGVAISSSISSVPVLGKRIRKPSLLRKECDETNLMFSAKPSKQLQKQIQNFYTAHRRAQTQ
jgi:hypothetical protein